MLLLLYSARFVYQESLPVKPKSAEFLTILIPFAGHLLESI